jgi:predicted DNA-binding protein (UPF0278 family)
MRERVNKGMKFNRKMVNSSNENSWNLEEAGGKRERKPID